MNFVKTNVVGVDKPIKKIQTFLYENWANDDFNAYGRVYKHEKNGKTFPLYYGSNREYEEVLFDDSLEGSYFFNVGDSEKIKINGDVTSSCEILFSIDLSSIKGDIERQDEEIKQEVIEHLQRFKGIFNIEEIVTGLDNVYSNFNGVSDYFKDLQPYFHFKIKGEILYNINLKCTN